MRPFLQCFHHVSCGAIAAPPAPGVMTPFGVSNIARRSEVLSKHADECSSPDSRGEPSGTVHKAAAMMPSVRTADDAADSRETARHRRTWFRVESIVRVGVLPRAG